MSSVYCVYCVFMYEGDRTEMNIVGVYSNRKEAVDAAVLSAEEYKKWIVKDPSEFECDLEGEDECFWPSNLEEYFSKNSQLKTSNGDEIIVVVGITDKTIGESSFRETLI